MDGAGFRVGALGCSYRVYGLGFRVFRVQGPGIVAYFCVDFGSQGSGFESFGLFRGTQIL